MPVGLKAAKQNVVVRSSCCRLVQHDNVQSGQVVLMVPERLSDNSFQSVSTTCEPTVFLADRKAQSWLVCAIWPVENGKHVVAAAVGTLKDATKGGFVGKPASTSEAAV